MRHTEFSRQSFMGRKQVVHYGKHRGKTAKMGRIKHIKGQDYDTLNNSYIIFICLSDLFGKNRYMYTFENVCKEDSDVMLNDGAKKIFLNADGRNGAVSEELKAFLDYVAG